jgi:tetratricopeptide (TPR) repeat protein
VYIDLGQTQLAFDTAQQALALDAGIAIAYYARGRAEYALGEFEAAEKDLSLSYRYIESNIPPEASFRSLLRAKILYNVALGKIGIGDDPAAQALLTQSIEAFKSGYAPAYLARGEVFLRTGAYDQARPDFNTAINLLKPTPNDPALYQAYMGNGLAFLGLGRPDSAVTNFQLVARNQPENFQAFLYWGQALVLNGGANQAEDALEPLTTALGLTQAETESAQAFYWRARAYQILKRTAEEIADLNAVAALEAEDLAPTAVARLTEIGPLPSATSPASPTPAVTATVRPPSATPTPTRTSRTATPTRTP